MRYCENCRAIQENLRGEECEICGGPLIEGSAPKMNRPNENAPPRPMLGNKYPAVRTLSAICRVLAFIGLVVGVSVAAVSLFAGTSGSLAFAAFAAVYSLAGFIVLLAVSEGLRVVVDIEANTRASAEYLRGRE